MASSHAASPAAPGEILAGAGLRSGIATAQPVTKLDGSRERMDTDELTDSQRFPPGGPPRAIASDFIGSTSTGHELEILDPYGHIVFLESFYYFKIIKLYILLGNVLTVNTKNVPFLNL